MSEHPFATSDATLNTFLKNSGMSLITRGEGIIVLQYPPSPDNETSPKKARYVEAINQLATKVRELVLDINDPQNTPRVIVEEKTR